MDGNAEAVANRLASLTSANLNAPKRDELAGIPNLNNVNIRCFLDIAWPTRQGNLS
jgi:hypothetical protein